MSLNICKKIQWSKTHTDKDGIPVCPECGEEAEMIIGVMGNPCWAHKRSAKERMGKQNDPN